MRNTIPKWICLLAHVALCCCVSADDFRDRFEELCERRDYDGILALCEEVRNSPERVREQFSKELLTQVHAGAKPILDNLTWERTTSEGVLKSSKKKAKKAAKNLTNTVVNVAKGAVKAGINKMPFLGGIAATKESAAASKAGFENAKRLKTAAIIATHPVAERELTQRRTEVSEAAKRDAAKATGHATSTIVPFAGTAGKLVANATSDNRTLVQSLKNDAMLIYLASQHKPQESMDRDTPEQFRYEAARLIVKELYGCPYHFDLSAQGSGLPPNQDDVLNSVNGDNVFEMAVRATESPGAANALAYLLESRKLGYWSKEKPPTTVNGMKKSVTARLQKEELKIEKRKDPHGQGLVLLTNIDGGGGAAHEDYNDELSEESGDENDQGAGTQSLRRPVVDGNIDSIPLEGSPEDIIDSQIPQDWRAMLGSAAGQLASQSAIASSRSDTTTDERFRKIVMALLAYETHPQAMNDLRNAFSEINQFEDRETEANHLALSFFRAHRRARFYRREVVESRIATLNRNLAALEAAAAEADRATRPNAFPDIPLQQHSPRTTIPVTRRQDRGAVGAIVSAATTETDDLIRAVTDAPPAPTHEPERDDAVNRNGRRAAAAERAD